MLFAGPGTLLSKVTLCSADLDEADSGGSVQEANLFFLPGFLEVSRQGPGWTTNVLFNRLKIRTGRSVQ